jgi:tRNA dimethylallyltransferase
MSRSSETAGTFFYVHECKPFGISGVDAAFFKCPGNQTGVNLMVIEDRVDRRFKNHWNLMVILGPTASGKTGLAVRLARRIGGEILSADSRQVYRGMDLGTGKELAEYDLGGEGVPVHLIDILDPTEEFNVFAFQERFYASFHEISGRGRIPVLVGGTGLYLDSVLRGYRMLSVPVDSALREKLAQEEMDSLRRHFLRLCPNAHNSTDLLQRNRIIRAIEIAQFSRETSREAWPAAALAPLVIGIRCERNDLRRRITLRLQARIEAGMVDEVQRLHDRGISWQRLESFGLEYRYISRHLQQKITWEEMFQTLNTRIHQFAKRQETWFRRMEKNGVRIHWIEGADENAALGLIIGLKE